MRHIKLFEGFNKDEYYQEITELPYYEIDEEESKRVFILLNKMLDSVSMDITYRHEIIIDFRDLDMWIICAVDEYYYIRYDDGTKQPYGYYYKCDQWDGLLELLKDKGIIK